MEEVKIRQPEKHLDDIRQNLESCDDVIINLSRGGVIRAAWAEVIERRSELVHTLKFGSIQIVQSDGAILNRTGGYLAEYLSDINSLEFLTY